MDFGSIYHPTIHYEASSTLASGPSCTWCTKWYLLGFSVTLCFPNTSMVSHLGAVWSWVILEAIFPCSLPKYWSLSIVRQETGKLYPIGKFGHLKLYPQSCSLEDWNTFAQRNLMLDRASPLLQVGLVCPNYTQTSIRQLLNFFTWNTKLHQNQTKKLNLVYWLSCS